MTTIAPPATDPRPTFEQIVAAEAPATDGRCVRRARELRAAAAAEAGYLLSVRER